MTPLRLIEPPNFRLKIKETQIALDTEAISLDELHAAAARPAANKAVDFAAFAQKTLNPIPHLKVLELLTIRGLYFVLEHQAWRAYYSYEPPDVLGALYFETGPVQGEQHLLNTLFAASGQLRAAHP